MGKSSGPLGDGSAPRQPSAEADVPELFMSDFLQFFGCRALCIEETAADLAHAVRDGGGEAAELIE